MSIPNGVTEIRDGTFAMCTKLTSIEIPSSVTSIGYRAFENCVALTSVSIPNGVTSIGRSAFSSCRELTTVTIPNSVTTIGREAFWWSGLTSVEIPNSVTSLDLGVFQGCSRLISVTIPNSVTSIGQMAFEGCSSLSSISIPNSVSIIYESTFSGCNKLTTLNLSENLEIIRKSAFSNCSSLEILTIPSKVEYIYQEAFSGCSALKKVEALPENPPFLYDNSFSNFSIPLKVPKGCKEAYQTAQGWENFTNISDADKYKIVYLVDGEQYKSYEIEEGASITPESEPSKEGYTFSGWSDIPETMPAEDVTVTGMFTINKYKVTYIIDGEEYKTEEVEYGSTITPPNPDDREGFAFAWDDYPSTMPAKDITITGSYTATAIEAILATEPDVKNYTISGKPINKLQKGVNILRYRDGRTRKIILK